MSLTPRYRALAGYQPLILIEAPQCCHPDLSGSLLTFALFYRPTRPHQHAGRAGG